MIWKLSEICACQKVLSMALLEDEGFCKSIIVKEYLSTIDKRLKKSHLKAWLQCNCQRLLVILVTYIIEILTRIMTDNIIPVYIQLLEIPYNF